MLLEWTTQDHNDDPFGAWRNDIMLDATPWAVGLEPEGQFSAAHKVLMFDGVQLGHNTISGATGERRLREIRASTLEKYTCVFMTSGTQGVVQDHFNRTVNPGEIYLWDSEKPCAFESMGLSTQIEICVPKERIHQLTGGKTLSPNVISGTTGIGAVLGQFLETAMDNAADFSGDQNDTVSEIAIQLILSGFSHQPKVQPTSHRSQNLLRVQQYIEKNLMDSQLSPTLVAEENRISVRYLHLMFAQSSTTFSKYLNGRRIARIQAELQNRSASNQTLTQLAFHYGFSSSAQFSRVFKRVCGQTPRSYRNSLTGSQKGINT